jgi:hypothetical protein
MVEMTDDQSKHLTYDQTKTDSVQKFIENYQDYIKKYPQPVAPVQPSFPSQGQWYEPYYTPCPGCGACPVCGRRNQPWTITYTC